MANLRISLSPKKNFMLKTVSMKHATFCHSNQHCESSLSVFQEKIRKNPEKSGKIRKNLAKNATVKILLISVKIFLASVKSFLEKAGVSQKSLTMLATVVKMFLSISFIVP